MKFFNYLAIYAILALLSPFCHAQQPTAQPATQPAAPATTATTPETQKDLDAKKAKKAKAAEQLKRQEHQRVLGIIPEFNTTNLDDAVSLSKKQKFQLAFKSAVDPFQFLIAGVDAGISQAENDFPGYGQGGVGYAKRFGASYADSFDGAILGNALFPSLLHEDPRYFRKGIGSIKGRLGYAVMSTFRCKNDNGNWAPNFGNLLGNLAAGGISNLYYPSTDRGAGLTIQRAFTVTAEGAFGAVLFEFWPDIQRKYLHRKQ